MTDGTADAKNVGIGGVVLRWGLQRTTQYSWGGQVTSQVEGATTVSYEYDALGRLKKQTETGPDGQTVQAYDGSSVF